MHATGRKFGSTPARVVWVLFFLCLLPEAIFMGSDAALWGSTTWRVLSYEYAAFWAGLLHDWTPNYPFQPWLMFISYGFLHAGPVHFLVNMLTLLSLGAPLAAKVGSRRFLVLYTASLIGGGFGFAAFGTESAPMVGASGALFGLVGALLSLEFDARAAKGQSLWPVLQAVLGLGALNLILWWAMDGRLAWETHLGGFLTGWLVAVLISVRAPSS